MKNHHRTIDFIATAILLVMLAYSTILLVNASSNGEHLGEWIWDRHQNLFSWYSRPLFIIPACYYAYRRKIGFIIGFMVLLACSLFWFAPPLEVPESISGYLDWERKAFLNPDNRQPLILLTAAVLVFLVLLFYSFWKRSYLLGLVVFNLGNLLKIAVSIAFGEDAGMASIVPTLSSMLVVNLLAFGIWKWKKSR